MNDQAPSALGNISVWAWIWYAVAGAIVTGLLAWGLALAVLWWRDVLVIAWHLARAYRRRRKLVTAISVIPGAERPTQAMSAAELDAIHGPRLGAVVDEDRVTTGRLPALACHRHRTGSAAFRCTCDTPEARDGA